MAEIRIHLPPTSPDEIEPFIRALRALPPAERAATAAKARSVARDAQHDYSVVHAEALRELRRLHGDSLAAVAAAVTDAGYPMSARAVTQRSRKEL